jgi:hypothetical protein
MPKQTNCGALLLYTVYYSDRLCERGGEMLHCVNYSRLWVSDSMYTRCSFSSHFAVPFLVLQSDPRLRFKAFTAAKVHKSSRAIPAVSDKLLTFRSPSLSPSSDTGDRDGPWNVDNFLPTAKILSALINDHLCVHHQILTLTLGTEVISEMWAILYQFTRLISRENCIQSAKFIQGKVILNFKHHLINLFGGTEVYFQDH